MRIPAGDGGGGASLPELFGLLIELAAADSNIPQALRGHLGGVEDVLNSRDPPHRAKWIGRLASGQLVGSAFSESGTNKLGTFSTTLAPSGGRLVLNGTKYYSTGAIYADWLNFGAVRDGELVTGFVSATAPGVTRLDDWAGFGQALTGSGTTVFADAPVDEEDIVAVEDRSPYRSAFYQLVHLATLSGIARAASREVAELVSARRLTYTHAAAATPAADPQILQVVGAVRSAAYAAGAITLAAAESVQRVHDAARRGDEATIDQEGVAADIVVAQAQTTVASLVLDATASLFDALGASATDRSAALDRHWRNARTICSHNPLVYKQRIVGDFAVNGARPPSFWLAGQA